MTRRSFLRTLGIGIVATAALANVPSSVVRRSKWLAESGRDWATAKMNKAWDTFYKTHQRQPTEFVVGRDLFDTLRDELLHRQGYVFGYFDTDRVSFRAFVFEGSRVDWDGHGYDIKEIS